MASAALLAMSSDSLIVVNSELSFYVVSDYAAGLMLNVSTSIFLNNVTTQIEINKSSSGTNTAGIVVNMSGTSYNINNSRLAIYSNADYAPLLARHMSSLNLNVNLSYFSGWVNGSNSASQGLVVGTTVATSNLSLNNTQVWIFSWFYVSYFSLGAITMNSSSGIN